MQKINMQFFHVWKKLFLYPQLIHITIYIFFSNLWRFLLFVHATWLFKHTCIYIHSRYSTDWTNFLYYIESYYMWCKIFRLLLCLLNCPTHSKREQTEMTQIRMSLTFSPRFQSNKCIWKWIMLHKRMGLALITYLILKMIFFLRTSKKFQKDKNSFKCKYLKSYLHDL